MNRLILSPSAGRDIEQIFEYIENEAPDAAVEWAIALHEKLDFLTRYPHVGRTFPELPQDVRAIPFGRSLVYFRYQFEAVQVLHVLHSSRDVKSEWEAQ